MAQLSNEGPWLMQQSSKEQETGTSQQNNPSPGYYSFTSRINGCNPTVSRLGNGCLVVRVVSFFSEHTRSGFTFVPTKFENDNTSVSHAWADCVGLFATWTASKHKQSNG
jgi:hypothetical protein